MGSKKVALARESLWFRRNYQFVRAKGGSNGRSQPVLGLETDYLLVYRPKRGGNCWA
jgi:hypothetical protein